MLYRPTSSRPGITLLEVLAAIFIMGIGLLSLLTLFPLGALSMGRAVRDDRAAAIASSALGMAIAVDLPNDSAVKTALNTAPNGSPVLVDPYYSIIGAPNFGLNRCTPNYVANCSYAPQGPNTSVALWFSFLDEIRFDPSGLPANFTSPPIDRPSTYTWSYLLRRPFANIIPDIVELSVIVYAGRALDAADGERLLPAAGESVTGTATSNTINVTYTAGTGKPNIRSRTWILDVSPGGPGSAVNANSYRVATVTDTGAYSLAIEVEPALTAPVSKIVVMENVIAVVNYGTGWKP